MTKFTNGIPAPQLGDVQWRKATATVPFGECVELSALPEWSIGMRNSRDPDGPALVYTREEMSAFVHGARAGEFDDLTVSPRATMTAASSANGARATYLAAPSSVGVNTPDEGRGMSRSSRDLATNPG